MTRSKAVWRRMVAFAYYVCGAGVYEAPADAATNAAPSASLNQQPAEFAELVRLTKTATGMPVLYKVVGPHDYVAAMEADLKRLLAEAKPVDVQVQVVSQDCPCPWCVVARVQRRNKQALAQYGTMLN